MIGKTLGQYEILEQLGVGGMGEVYRAHDPNLRRDVAIKVLPEMLADDPERLARLEREAHSLAALNHPNVATIHGLESAGGIRFLVLELVEGDTLADRISGCPLKIDEALGIGAQIAEGLEAAHANGIIHRDLKPANIKITPEGRVKVLDFGLAKSTDPQSGGASGSGSERTAALTHSPTFATIATEAGVLLGTAPYMSPEQAKGRVVDKRTDVWAFGCVLYEMLTGAQPFEGDDVTEVIASILKEEPEWDGLPTRTPRSIQMLLRRCLRKDVDRRLRDIGDARIEIEDAISEPEDAIVDIRPGPSPDLWQRAAPWAVAAVATAVAVFAYTQFRPGNGSLPEYSQLDLDLLLGQEISVNSPLAVSPDGNRVVYKVEPEETPLLMRDLTQGTVAPISGTEGDAKPFFSPDGEWLGFFVRGNDNQLKKIRLDGAGGGPVPLCMHENNIGWGGGSWGVDGRIVFTLGTNERKGLLEVPADGSGDCTDLTTLDVSKGEILHRWPQMLPNGKGVLFTASGARMWDESAIVVYSFETREYKEVATGTYARYVPTEGPDSGHLLVARYEELHAVPFDAELLQPTGPEVPVVSDLFTATVGHGGAAHFSVSDSGRIVYRETLPSTKRRVVFIDLDGNLMRSFAEGRSYEVARFSPDGSTLALITEEGEVYLHEVLTGRPQLLTGPFTGASGIPQIPRFGVEWEKPAGTRLVIHTWSGGPDPLFLFSLNPGDEPSALSVPPGAIIFPVAFLQSGARLLYIRAGGNDFGLIERSLETGGDRQIMQPAFQPVLSADERLLAYWRRGSDSRPQIFVRAYHGGPEHPVSFDGGVAPVWDPKGRMLYFHHSDAIWKAEIFTEPELRVGTPVPLFDNPYYRAGGSEPRTYDLSPDGETFAMIENLEDPAVTERFQMIKNFFEVLRRRAPLQR